MITSKNGGKRKKVTSVDVGAVHATFLSYLLLDRRLFHALAGLMQMHKGIDMGHKNIDKGFQIGKASRHEPLHQSIDRFFADFEVILFFFLVNQRVASSFSARKKEKKSTRLRIA